jgi:RecJ-like exonuclease
MATITGTCGKCDGKGRIEAFGHIHNGLCFWCKGTGQITVNATAPATKTTEQLAADAEWARKAEWLRTCTAAQLARATWQQIYAAHAMAANMVAEGELSRKQFALVKAELIKQLDGAETHAP